MGELKSQPLQGDKRTLLLPQRFVVDVDAMVHEVDEGQTPASSRRHKGILVSLQEVTRQMLAGQIGVEWVAG
jgi:hypothetical protein